MRQWRLAMMAAISTCAPACSVGCSSPIARLEVVDGFERPGRAVAIANIDEKTDELFRVE